MSYTSKKNCQECCSQARDKMVNVHNFILYKNTFSSFSSSYNMQSVILMVIIFKKNNERKGLLYIKAEITIFIFNINTCKLLITVHLVILHAALC